MGNLHELIINVCGPDGIGKTSAIADWKTQLTSEGWLAVSLPSVLDRSVLTLPAGVERERRLAAQRIYAMRMANGGGFADVLLDAVRESPEAPAYPQGSIGFLDRGEPCGYAYGGGNFSDDTQLDRLRLQGLKLYLHLGIYPLIVVPTEEELPWLCAEIRRRAEETGVGKEDVGMAPEYLRELSNNYRWWAVQRPVWHCMYCPERPLPPHLLIEGVRHFREKRGEIIQQVIEESVRFQEGQAVSGLRLG